MVNVTVKRATTASARERVASLRGPAGEVSAALSSPWRTRSAWADKLFLSWILRGI